MQQKAVTKFSKRREKVVKKLHKGGKILSQIFFKRQKRYQKFFKKQSFSVFGML
jgi:hypothetical protein